MPGTLMQFLPIGAGHTLGRSPFLAACDLDPLQSRQGTKPPFQGVRLMYIYTNNAHATFMLFLLTLGSSSSSLMLSAAR